ncbi:MAG: glycosyltransferase [Rudaea sp.]
MTPNRSILVLGMHRSGTSALARVLGLMGAEIGSDDELLKAHPVDNPTGYWERAELTEIHDSLLAASGHKWDQVSGFDPHALDPVAAHASTQCIDRFVDRLNADGKPWLVKDPRLCLLLSPWLSILRNPAFVVAVRDPREIATSLSAGARGTFTSGFVLALWEKYLRTLLADMQGRRAVFVSYAELMAHPAAQCARLLRGLREIGVDGLYEASEAEVSAFLDSRLHRSVARAHVRLSLEQNALHHWLETQCGAQDVVTVSGVPQAAAPDLELAEYEACFKHHINQGRLLHGAETSGRLQRIESALAEHDAERVRLDAQHAQERTQWSTEISVQRQHFEAALQSERDTAAARAQKLETMLQAERDAAVALAQKFETTLQAERDVAAARAQAHIAEIDRLHERHTNLQRHATALDESVQALRTSWSWKLTAPLRAVSRPLNRRHPFNIEYRLYRWYYSVPGISPKRKRALIVWLHRHASWLTRNTLSYQIYNQAQQRLLVRTATREERERTQRLDASRAARLLETLPRRPLISIVMPVYNVDRRWLMAAVDSVRRQFYPHWELCIADDASTRDETRKTLDQLQAANDPRFKIARLPSNRGIALASNAAFALATGEFVGLLDHDDELTRDALLEVVRAINAQDPDLIYSDEDKTDESNVRRDPFFKPDFSLEYFFSNNYLCHFTVLRTKILKRIGGFREGVDGAQDFDLFLRFTEHTQRVAHIPKVLYHWRMIAGSTAAVASAKPYTWEAGRLALEHTLQNRGLAAHAEKGPFPNTYRVRYDINGEPLVSILIPFRDKPALLRVCVDSILKETDYANYEIIGIDNGSTQAETQALVLELEKRDRRVRFVRYDAPFNFSGINNFGARHAQGEHFLLLNNDTKVLSADWLRAMLEHSQRAEVGVVGARLLYPDDTVQHAGVVVDRHVVAMHPFQYTPAQHPGYAALPHLLHNVSAVTFACAMTRREVFEQLEGLDEARLPVCYNDVDYCLRAREAGYVIVYTPYAELRHFESKSRGIDDHLARTTRFRNELAFMQQRHATILRDGDPYYNPNLSLGVQGGYHPDNRYADELPL